MIPAESLEHTVAEYEVRLAEKRVEVIEWRNAANAAGKRIVELRAERDALLKQQADDAESLTAAANTIRELRAERDALAVLLRRVLSCTDLHGWNGAKAELLCDEIDAVLKDKP